MSDYIPRIDELVAAIDKGLYIVLREGTREHREGKREGDVNVVYIMKVFRLESKEDFWKEQHRFLESIQTHPCQEVFQD